MDLICATICYRGYGEDEFADTLENAPGIGYRAMEIHGPMTWSVDAVKALDPESLRRRIDSSGMRCAGIYPPGWGGSDDSDVEARARAIARCVEVTQALGGDHISTTGAQRRESPGALDRVKACAKRVLELVPDSTPVWLTLEPHMGNVLEQPADFSEVLESVGHDPRLGVCVDTGHFHGSGVDTIGFIRRFADRIYAVHLKDHIGTVSVGIGRGEIDLPSVISALSGADYTGDLTIELEVEDPENLPRYTQEAYVYMNGLLGRKL